MGTKVLVRNRSSQDADGKKNNGSALRDRRSVVSEVAVEPGSIAW
jgi:hypothetical protein